MSQFPSGDPCLTSPVFFWQVPVGKCSGPCGTEGCGQQYDIAEVNGTHVIERYYDTSDCSGDPAHVNILTLGECSHSEVATLQTLSVYSVDIYGTEAGCSGEVRGSSHYGLDVCNLRTNGVPGSLEGGHSILETCVSGDLVQYNYSSLNCTGDFMQRKLVLGDCLYSSWYGSITISDVSACTPSSSEARKNAMIAQALWLLTAASLPRLVSSSS